MIDVYKNKRQEPRVKIPTHVIVSGSDADGEPFRCETVTVDVSPHGASLALELPLRRGAIIDFAARDYSFHTRAVVRSIDSDRATGATIVGIEYLDDRCNPIVIWNGPAS